MASRLRFLSKLALRGRLAINRAPGGCLLDIDVAKRAAFDRLRKTAVRGGPPKALAPDVRENASFARTRSVAVDAKTGGRASSYQPPQSSRIVSLGIVLALHVGAFFVLSTMTSTDVKRLPSAPLVIELLPLNRPPPVPRRPTAKKLEPELPRRTVPEVVVPPPLAEMPTVAPAVRTTDVTPPLAPAIVVENAKSAPVNDPVVLDNLTLKLISAEPPTYPVTSRRKREQGEVVLEIVVGTDGKVEEISVKRSSGFENLDRAALVAVRRWRWSATVVGQQAVRVRGLVRIPFELRS